MARVLVIDDDEAVRNMVVAALAHAGHLVTAAANGRKGLELFRAEPADLIVTDIVMPERDGVEVMMTLRKEFPGVPVIVMSGSAINSTLYLNIAQKLGARCKLEKPFSAATLLRAVDEVSRESASRNATQCAPPIPH